MMNGFFYLYQVSSGEWEYLFVSEMSEIEFQNSSLLTKEHVSLIMRQERRYRIRKETKQHQEQNQKEKARIKLAKTGQQCRLNKQHQH